jgi:hypothetical protein
VTPCKVGKPQRIAKSRITLHSNPFGVRFDPNREEQIFDQMKYIRIGKYKYDELEVNGIEQVSEICNRSLRKVVKFGKS